MEEKFQIKFINEFKNINVIRFFYFSRPVEAAGKVFDYVDDIGLG